jgi:hypothetical protein
VTRPKLLFLVLFSAIVAIVASIAHAHAADFTVQHNGVTVFTAPGLVTNGGVYNFCDTPAQCGNTPPPPAPNQLTRANVSYPPSTAARSADLTKWAETWGRVTITSSGSPWPLAGGAAPQWTLGRNQFTCTPFTTTNVTGLSQLSMMSYYTAGNVDVSIARTCGDFSVPPPCSKQEVGAFASQFMIYRIGASTSAFCGLAPATTYYLNLRFHNGQPVDPNPAHPLCTALGCKVSIKSNPATR